VVLAVVVGIGLAVWGRRVHRRSAAVWVVVLAVLVVQLLTLQNRTYPRYAIAVQLAVAPLVAGAAALVPIPLALGVLAAAVGGAAWSSWPLLVEQHRTELPAWSAACRAEVVARNLGWTAVVGPEVHVFASYRWHVLERRGIDPPPLVLSPRAPEPWEGVSGPWVVATVHRHLYLDSLVGEEQSWGGVSPRLRRLTQDRFLEASVIANPPLPIGQWWTREVNTAGEVFMWAGADADLWVPPLPEGARLRIPLRIRPGPEPLEIRSDGVDTAVFAGESGAAKTLDVARERRDGPWVVAFHRADGYPPGGGDSRPLAVAVANPWFRPPHTGFRIDLGAPEARARDRLVLEGAYPLEQFGRLGAGHWLRPEAAVVVDVPGAGMVELELAAPRPTAPETTVSMDGGVTIGPVDFSTGSHRVALAVPGPRRGARIELESVPYVPAEAGVSSDRRILGVVITGVSWLPSAVAPDGWWRRTLDEPMANAAR
jgi:hypothetical protein